MDALVLVLLIILAGVGMGVIGLLASSVSRYRLAAWLITTAHAMDEKRVAIAAIEEERRLAQKQLENRLCSGKSLEVVNQ